jgi:hypothetical protein
MRARRKMSEAIGCVLVSMEEVSDERWDVRSIEVTTGEVLAAVSGGVTEARATELYESAVQMWRHVRDGGIASPEMVHCVRDLETTSDTVH